MTYIKCETSQRVSYTQSDLPTKQCDGFIAHVGNIFECKRCYPVVTVMTDANEMACPHCNSRMHEIGTISL